MGYTVSSGPVHSLHSETLSQKIKGPVPFEPHCPHLCSGVTAVPPTKKWIKQGHGSQGVLCPGLMLCFLPHTAFPPLHVPPSPQLLTSSLVSMAAVGAF
jgi:hypothetical protein